MVLERVANYDAEYEAYELSCIELADRMGVKPFYAQKGYQFDMLTTEADIAVGGAAAGVGKTAALLLEAQRYAFIPHFASIIFRRIRDEHKNPGGLWDEANKIYPDSVGGVGTPYNLTWRFPSTNLLPGAWPKIVFDSIQYDKNLEEHKGGQYPVILFDELTGFTKKMFFYLLSRNRTDIGIRPYVRATTNPQREGWVKDMLAWYIYPDDYPDQDKAGYPRTDRIGVLRYFVIDQDEIIWGNNKEEVLEQCPWLYKDLPEGISVYDKIKSFTFIPGQLSDNQILLKKNPGYAGSLHALSEEDRLMLYNGCWKYTPGANELFDYDCLQDMEFNDFVDGAGRFGQSKRYITADIAGLGADKFVVMVWDNWRLIYTESFAVSGADIIKERIEYLSKRYKVPRRNIAYDRGGIGGLLPDILRRAHGVNTGGGVLARKGSKFRDNTDGLKSQLFYMAREWVNASKVYVDAARIGREQYKWLIEELRAHKRRDMEKETKLRISDKEDVKRLLKPRRSPDFADAFVLRWYFELMIPPPVTVKTSAG